MAKSKGQKQLEALQRKREGIDSWRLWYMDRQYGAQGYKDNVKRRGQEEADLIAQDAKRHFEKLCKEAQVDTHGNPLPGSPDYNDPGLLLDPDAMVRVNRQFVGRKLREQGGFTIDVSAPVADHYEINKGQ